MSAWVRTPSALRKFLLVFLTIISFSRLPIPTFRDTFHCAPQWHNRLARRTYRQYLPRAGRGLRNAEVVSSSLTWGSRYFSFRATIQTQTLPRRGKLQASCLSPHVPSDVVFRWSSNSYTIILSPFTNNNIDFCCDRCQNAQHMLRSTLAYCGDIAQW